MPSSFFFRPLVAAVSGLVMLAACQEAAVGPEADRPGGAPGFLVQGAPDLQGHGNVGLLAFDVDGSEGPLPPFALCTGSVLSETVFLTAAHCIETAPRARWAVTLEPGSPEDPVVVPGVFPDDFPFRVIAPVVYADEVVVHPQFDGDPPSARRHDVAVLLFPEGTFAGVTPVELPHEGELDALAARGGLHGQDFTLVGYGTVPIAGEINGKFVPGYRQVTSAPFQGLSRDWFLFQMTGAATDQGGLCSGDSGSPDFLGGSNVAMALLGGGGINQVCGTGVARSQRLDTPAERDFIGQFVALP